VWFSLLDIYPIDKRMKGSAAEKFHFAVERGLQLDKLETKLK
jgi:hypothetical protein